MPGRPDAAGRAHAPGRSDDLLALVDLGDGVLAGFTSRAGGRSVGPWSGLNLGTAVGDDPAHVAANRRTLARRVGAPVVFGTQVHGTGVVAVGPADALREAPEADALVTTLDDVALGVYVADCVPVLLADPDARVVAAVHAGRRGLAGGVLQAAVAAMVRAGADARRVRAAVGPCVAAAAYEVPAALRDEVTHVVPETWAVSSAGTPALDLTAGVRAVLGRCGVATVGVDGRDTATDPGLYSHRRAAREGVPTGRSAGVVRLLPRGPSGG